ncbi:hypothetical protein LCGC14_1459790 [marine sediment metagenome]|uniref:Uncharacterized protein n=1 Tax=marine sediment metagenome TaxID=412755 RepID=A0A0F9JG01_9ZZZZ
MEPLKPIGPDSLRKLTASAEMFNGILTQHVKDLLEDPTFRQRVISVVNEKVNIPVMPESMEGKLFETIYDFAVSGIIGALETID